MNQLESYHYKIGVKLDCLEQIATALGRHDSSAAIERIRINYSDGVAPILAKFYQTTQPAIPKTVDPDHELDDDACSLYMKFISSDNTVEKMDYQLARLKEVKTTVAISRPSFHPEPTTLGGELEQLAKDLESLFINSSFSKNPQVDIDALFKTYKDQQIQTSIQRIRINTCSNCNGNMTPFPDTSEMRCDSPDCGQIVTLYGIVFEDSQFYNQQTVCTKSKKYDPNGHLSKWIDKIQAKEDYQFDQNIISTIDDLAIREFTRNGKLRPMTNLRCETVREWLQRFRFTDAYDHAPLLRKIITSMHGQPIVPPELTPEERQEILIECSLSLREFEIVIKDPDLLRRLDKERVRNKFYYPYVLWQIINLRIKDQRKRRRLLECIHLQSDKTLRNDDIVWREICTRRGYQYFAAQPL